MNDIAIKVFEELQVVSSTKYILLEIKAPKTTTPDATLWNNFKGVYNNLSDQKIANNMSQLLIV